MTTAQGENCPVDQVIVDETSCRDAAVALGRPYDNSYRNDSKYPAGCFTEHPVLVVFNHQIDPSKTQPVQSSAGVCRLLTSMVVNNRLVQRLY